MWPVFHPRWGTTRPSPVRGRFGPHRGKFGRSHRRSREAGKPFSFFCFSQAGNKTHRSLKPTHSSPFREGKQSACPTLSVGTKGGQVSPAGSVGSGRSPPGTLAPAPTLQKGKKPMKQKKDRTFTVRFTEEQFPPHPGAGGQGHDDPQQLHPSSAPYERSSR